MHHCCLHVCFKASFWVETRQIFTKSQILLLTVIQKQPPVMQSINIHGPCCKDGGKGCMCEGWHMVHLENWLCAHLLAEKYVRT
jgi:hypothetical protein